MKLRLTNGADSNAFFISLKGVHLVLSIVGLLTSCFVAAFGGVMFSAKVTVPSVGTATWATTGNATTPTENWTFAGLDGRGYIAIDDIKYATSTAR